MNLAEQIEIACLMEATARKPGNVHPGASFDDLDYRDFDLAASAIAGPLSSSRCDGLGKSVLNAIKATQRESRSNVNLGISLLIAPLAAVPEGVSLQSGIRNVVESTTVDDAEQVYAAIRLARPGGMGTASTQDVGGQPTVTLQDAMILAADRDRIAEQYASNFAYVLGLARHWLLDSWRWCQELSGILPQLDELMRFPGIVAWEAALIRFQIKLLADAPDSLVVRKCGTDVAGELQRRAIEVDRLDWPARRSSWTALRDLDLWLRGDGNRRNPGTTADLIAATTFAAIRDGHLIPPSRDEIRRHASEIQSR